MADQEMEIFRRTFDFLTWLLPVTNHFPRAHRHSFTRRLLDAAFYLQERLGEANHRRGRARLERLERAAELAVYYSRARHSETQVSVNMTERRFVRRVRGKYPGLVTYRNERTLWVKVVGMREPGAGRR